MKIKALGGQSVLCEDAGCGKPAVYLFSQTAPVVMYIAYCEAHAVRCAERLRVALPQAQARLGPEWRGEQAIA